MPIRKRLVPKLRKAWNPKKHGDRSKTPPALVGEIHTPIAGTIRFFQPPGKLGRYKPAPEWKDHETLQEYDKRVAPTRKRFGEPIGHIINPSGTSGGTTEAIGAIYFDRREQNRRYRKLKK